MTLRLSTGAVPLRAVVTGRGFRARQWADALRAHPDTVLAEGAPSAAADEVAQLLDATRPDLLVDCSGPAELAVVALAALARGVPVLVGRPPGISFQETAALVEAADRAGQLLMVAQEHRYPAGFGALCEQVRSLGPLALLSSEFRLPYRPVARLDAWQDPLLRELAVPVFDAARAISGCEALSVSCAGEDSATAVFLMPGGLRFLFSGSWSAEGPPTSWQGRWHVVGERGSARWDGERAESPATSGPTDTPTPGPNAGPAAGLTEFVSALRGGAPPRGECHDYLRTLAMVEAAARSARSGRLEPVSAGGAD